MADFRRFTGQKQKDGTVVTNENIGTFATPTETTSIPITDYMGRTSGDSGFNTAPASPAQNVRKSGPNDSMSYAPIDAGDNPTATFSPNLPKPTVATKDNPVVDRTPQTNNAYQPYDYTDLQGMDKNGLQDYIDYYSVKAQDGKPLSQEEKIRLMKAGRLLQEKQTSAATNPYDQLIAKGQEKLDARQQELLGQETTALDTYKKQLEAQYTQKRADVEQAGKRTQEAMQNNLSFSGFGRSTYAADKQQEIQDKITNAFNSLEAEKEAMLQAKRLELSGVTGKALEGLQGYIQELQKSSAQFVADSVKQANEFNQQGAQDYQEKIDNILKLGSGFGVTPETELDDEQKQLIASIAELAIDKNGNINETLLKSVPASLAGNVLQAAAMVKGAQGQKGDYQFIGADKYNSAMIFDKSTGAFVPVGNQRGVTGGGGGGIVSNNGDGTLSLKQLPGFADLAATANSKTKLTSTQVENLSNVGTIVESINKVQKLLSDGNYTSGPLGSIVGSFNPYATNTQEAQQLFGTTAQLVGRFLEGGKLAEGDIGRYQRMLPKLGDTPDVAQKKLENVKDMILSEYNSQLNNSAKANYNVSEFNYIPSKDAVFTSSTVKESPNTETTKTDTTIETPTNFDELRDSL